MALQLKPQICGSLRLESMLSFTALKTSNKPPPPVISIGGYQRIRRYGLTNGRAFDLPRPILDGRIIEVSGQRGGKLSSRVRHFPSFKVREAWFQSLPLVCVLYLAERAIKQASLIYDFMT